MPKKKGHKKNFPQDFTINDCANAPKPLSRAKKSVNESASLSDVSWDKIADDNLDVMEDISSDGTRCLVFKKKRKNSEPNEDVKSGAEYPEVIWYLISKHIAPEDIGRFARINRATYTVTRQKSFWVNVYRKYCKGHSNLPKSLQFENQYRTYGLRTQVIKALYLTHEYFIRKLKRESNQGSKPHELVKRRCLNIQIEKRRTFWSILFKFKKAPIGHRNKSLNMIEELGRIDANPEEDSQVMQVNCQHLTQVPPLLGMTLTSLNLGLAKELSHYRLHMGFQTGQHVSHQILPECSVVIDMVTNILVLDWWHPAYPHFDINLPCRGKDEETLPLWDVEMFPAELSCNAHQTSMKS